jgi:DNA-binding response OmpR family regulator
MVGAGPLLLVEDEANLRDLVARFLRTEGYEVVEAPDGREAVLRLSEGAYGRFAVAMVDLNLPEVDGVEVCRVARRVDPGLPLLVCSAAVEGEHARSLKSIGVDRYLSKPYHPAHLLRELAGLRRSASNLVSAPPAPLG